MSSVNTNVAGMAAIRSLGSISRDMMTTQARIESGLKISQANHDPAVFSIAQNMRADLSGLVAVRDSLAFGKAAVTVARDASTKISDELGKLKQTITQGQQQGIDANQINAQITGALANIDAYARTATFNGVNLLLQGASPPAPTGTLTTLNVVRDIIGNTTAVAGTDSTSAGLSLASLNVNSGGMRMTFGAAFAPANGDSISFTTGGQTHVFELSDGSAQLVNQPTATRRVNDVQILGTDSPLQIVAKVINRMQQEGFNASLDQDGRLVVGGNITGLTARAAAGGPLAGTSAASVGGTTGAIAAVETAVDTMGTRLANLGAALRQIEGLQDFSQKLQDSLKEGLGALVDADLAEESARLTSLQTRQQLATQSLSIANQQSQSLLSLFR